MSKLLELLKKLQQNPDQVEVLPEILAEAERVTNQAADDLNRITRLQESNRSLLQQIPIADGKPKDEPPEEKPPTIDQAVAELREEMKLY